MPFPKTPVKRLRTRRQVQQAADRKGSDECRKRSGGQCEVWEQREVPPEIIRGGLLVGRCGYPAEHVHHMYRGRGKRLSAEGVKAERKQHVCSEHHREIDAVLGGAKLVLQQAGALPRWDDTYKRVRKAAA
jgi:hypothetical protein